MGVWNLEMFESPNYVPYTYFHFFSILYFTVATEKGVYFLVVCSGCV